MGCDIHLYPEYKRRKPDPKEDWQSQWSEITPRINPGRNYELFGYLAGVRYSGPPVVKPRGVPDDMGWHAQRDYWLSILDDAHADDIDELFPVNSVEAFNSLEQAEQLCLANNLELPSKILHTQREINAISPENAARYAAMGSKYFYNQTGRRVAVEHPDWHTPSWLTTQEFAKALRLLDHQAPAYGAILAAMEYLEALADRGLLDFVCRIVFWFDN